jgi:hypothetical protein
MAMARTKELVFSGKEGEMGSEGEGLRHHPGLFISAELEPHSVCGLLGSVLWTGGKVVTCHDEDCHDEDHHDCHRLE